MAPDFFAILDDVAVTTKVAARNRYVPQTGRNSNQILEDLKFLSELRVINVDRSVHQPHNGI